MGGRFIVGLFLIAIGVSYLLDINLWQYFWPAILILVGVWFILDRPGHFERRHWEKKTRWQPGETVGESDDKTLNYSASFQGIDRKITTDDFKGGVVNATFGGVNLDLTNAKIKSKGPVSLQVDATLGGIKIRVPKTWLVENNISGVVGGVHDTTQHPVDKDKTGILKLFGQATLGGVEITN